MPLFDWIEIPVEDLDRAARFYSAVLETDLEVTELQPGYRVAFLPIPEDTPAGPGGMLVETEGFGPAGEQGCRVCFGAAADIDGFLMRVEEAGGRISQPKTRLDDGNSVAYLAWFYDTEGNLLGVHVPG